MNPSFPAVFGKYILLKPLARGGMGEILLAVAGEMGGFEKLCVIKRVRAGSGNESLVRRFQDEGKVVVKLSHGNLVQVFDVGTVGKEVYLAMEYVEGCDLRDLMVRSDEMQTPVPVEVALYVAMQLLRGLHYAHTYSNLRLVHRDICPSNVLVSFTGEVKITDFGLAQSVLKQEMTGPGKIYGRFSYLAPEQARRESVDARTDIYSTGIILWELLVGQPMRSRGQEDPTTALSVIRAGKVVPPSARNARVPAELDAVVSRALQPRREERYPTADTMRGELAKVLARRNPAFDAGGLASFVRHVYGDRIERMRAERERLLAQDFTRYKRSSQGFESLTGEEPEEDLSGQVVDGRYRVIRLLGEGGMGAVYEAEHMEIGRRVAIKIMHAAYSSHPETMARFRQEARAATQIGHPNIVEVTDSGATAAGRLFFVMELLSGVDLAQVMAETRIVPARRALRITLQICKALHAAHEEGIVHRDLKPENVFLIEREGKGDFVKILDFGIAKNVGLERRGDSQRLTHPGMAMGTPEYMAPEQAAGEDIDRRIDVYATGAMLYEMLTGHLPHEGENLMQVLSRKASQPVTPPTRYRPTMPKGLETVIFRAIAFERDERHATMEELGAELLPFTAAGATRWAEQTPSGSPVAPDGASPEEDLEVDTEKVPKDPSLVTDPTVPLAASPDGSDPARVVSPGEVKISKDVVPISRSKVAMDSAARLDIGMQVTAPSPTVNPARRLRWPLIIAVLVVVGGAGAAGAILWPGSATDGGRDAGSPDAALDDAGLRPDTVRPKLTEQEVLRLIEWARRAAAGGRFTRPAKDNVRYLFARVERDYPNHPEVVKLRAHLVKRLAHRARREARRRHYGSAERLLRIWLALVPDDRTPHLRIAALHVAQGRRSLARRKYRDAARHAKAARKNLPESVAVLELSGDVEIRRKNYGRAVKYFEEALGQEKVTRRARRRLKKKLGKAKRLDK
jgi:serine/threonine-protein kinase